MGNIVVHLLLFYNLNLQQSGTHTYLIYLVLVGKSWMFLYLGIIEPRLRWFCYQDFSFYKLRS